MTTWIGLDALLSLTDVYYLCCRHRPISKLKSDQKLQGLVNLLYPSVVKLDLAREEEFNRKRKPASAPSSSTNSTNSKRGDSHPSAAKKIRNRSSGLFDQILAIPDTSCPPQARLPKLPTGIERLEMPLQCRMGEIRKKVAKLLKLDDPEQVCGVCCC